MAYSVAVLLSGSGSNLQALIDAEAAGKLGKARICFVVSDQAEAYGLQRALVHQIASAYLPLPRTRNSTERPAIRAAWEQRLATMIAAFSPDLIVLAGFMRILSPRFLDQFPERVINQHPALLPDDGGSHYTTSSGIQIPALRGAHVVPDALAHGLPLTGCTIHRVTPRVDDGPILARTEVPILPHDSIETLHERIKLEERRMIVEVVARLSLL
ncbi:phosphoribosylglycinamide formyltransferase [Candidatus Viridilinea mediisalina]|uniref:Phosphoribosylglycinamide formyltransferase n=1 Tax=Candidatus Viridilinea mediisalina TaxID=2024553 RepID=A0A2A6RL55_9CHLR|nr:phosphoribosylglycinamide formyltransferase [Candidatus Viridilinea mediisalina]PDW03636.1 phosphoribosylglycinamide formyltransferase [Candidatus Viridilinea mediisalina]